MGSRGAQSRAVSVNQDNTLYGSQPGASCSLFLHLPKTAGTTLRNHVVENVSAVFTHYSNQDWLDFVYSRGLSNIDCFFGHFNYGTHSLLKHRGYDQIKTFTMLRNPIERVISAYYYHNALLPWKPCLQSGEGLCGEYENDMVKRLSGLAPPNGYDLQALNQRLPYATTNHEHLALAKENLTRLTTFGITEQFEASITLFNAIFGWQGLPEKQVNHRHKLAADRPRQSDLQTDVLDMIYEYNQLDLELYEYALSLFKAQSKLADQTG